MSENKPFWVGVATIITLCMVSLAMRFLPEAMMNTGSLVADFTPDLPVCKGDNCSWQGWLSALSGYFALVAAFIGVGITWRGLQHQARQTDFVLGNGPPEFRIQSSGTDRNGTIYEVINWNKKHIYIEKIEIKRVPKRSFGYDLVPRSISLLEMNNPKSRYMKRALNNGAFGAAFGVEGWIERQKAPTGWTFYLEIAETQIEPTRLSDFYEVCVSYFMHSHKGRMTSYSMCFEAELGDILSIAPAKL